MSDLEHIEPISAVKVAALICKCGACDSSFSIDYEALDDGRVDPAHDFGNCPECGTVFDAQRARFRAYLSKEAT